MKKIIFVMLSVCFISSAFAVTPNQLRLIKREALNVMLSNGAESIQSPEVTSLKIVAENAQYAVVEFQGVEYGPYYYKCQFTYDLQTNKTVRGSARCSN